MPVMTSKVSSFGSLQDRLSAHTPPVAPPPVTHPQPRHVLVEAAPGEWVPGLMAGWWRRDYDGAWIARVVLIEGEAFVVRDMIGGRVRPL